MLARCRAHLTYANLMATVAVFVALGGSSYAALKIGSGNIKDNSIRSKDVRNRTLTGLDVKDRSLTNSDFGAGQLPVGPAGAPGGQGPQGIQGAQGLAGQDGSPDTGTQILGKLAPVDGAGSGLDADTLDDTSKDSFLSFDDGFDGAAAAYANAGASEIIDFPDSGILVRDDTDAVADLSVVVENTNTGASPANDLHVMRSDTNTATTVTPGANTELTSTNLSLNFTVAENGPGSKAVAVTCAWDPGNSNIPTLYCFGLGLDPNA